MLYCLFDIDGTLLNSGGAGQAAMEEAVLTLAEQPKDMNGISTAGRTDRAIISDLFERFEISLDEENWQRFLNTYLELLPRNLHEREGVVLPGVSQLLDAISQLEEVELGLLTGNFREGARLKLEHFDLFHHFSFGAYGDVHTHRNEVAKVAYDEVSRRHGSEIEPERIWIVGDTPADVECARAIGAHVAAVCTGVYSRETLEATKPDMLFDDFSAPQHLLNCLKWNRPFNPYFKT